MIAGFTLSGILFSLFTLIMIRRGGSLRSATWLMVVSLSLGIGLSSEFSSRFESLAIWFMATPVLMAIPFVESRDLRRMSLLPIGVILAFIGLEGVIPPSGTDEMTSSHYFYSQVQILFIYVYMSYHATRLGEREIEALAGHRQRSSAEAERAEQENQKRTKFLAKMSHELRTPMNGMLGMVQYLEARDLSPESRSLLLRLRRRSEHILEHINDALDLTQLDAGTEMKTEVTFDLSGLVSRVCDIQTQFGTLKKCALDVQIELESQVFTGDIRRLRHLLSTLLGTAFQESNNGLIKLRVSESKDSANDTRAPKALPIFFDVEYSVDTQSPMMVEESIDGASLVRSGLASTGSLDSLGVSSRVGAGDLSAKFASAFRVSELLGGRFQVAKEQRDRVIVTAQIPLRVSNEVCKRITLAPEKPRRTNTSYGLRALVVDDNAINRKIAGLLLKKLGCEFHTANDGIHGVQMARENHYDVIFMDLRMPKMDGFEAARTILKERGAGQDGCPIMALTANAYQEDVDKALASGMVAHIAKPVTLEKLESVLDEYVSSKRVLPELQRVSGESRR